MHLGGLRDKVLARREFSAGSNGSPVNLSEQIKADKKIKKILAEKKAAELKAAQGPQRSPKQVAYIIERNRILDSNPEFVKLKNLLPLYMTFSQYRTQLIDAQNRLKQIDSDATARARSYADSQYPDGGLSGLSGTYGGGQTVTVNRDVDCTDMGGRILGRSGPFYRAGAYGTTSGADPSSAYYEIQCYLPPAPAAQQSQPSNIRVNVNPTIQTQISPQISPAFQQAFQPSNSPMTAGTSQNMPSSQTAAPPAPAPQYQAPVAAPVAPVAAPDNSAALLAQQQKIYDALIAKLTAPSGVPTSSLPAPAPIAPPMPTYQAAPLPIQSSAPLPVDASLPPVSGDMTGALPQIGLSTGGQTAAAAFAAQNPPASLPVTMTAPAPSKSNLPLIFAILAGAGILFIGSSQHKGKRHAAR